jgi:hypothetical protein
MFSANIAEIKVFTPNSKISAEFCNAIESAGVKLAYSSCLTISNAILGTGAVSAWLSGTSAEMANL